MTNLNSKSEFFEGKKVFDNTTHHSMPKIKAKPRKRRRTGYRGITNQVQGKPKLI